MRVPPPSVYGVSRVTCHREPGPPISMSKVRGSGVEARDSTLGYVKLDFVLSPSLSHQVSVNASFRDPAL